MVRLAWSMFDYAMYPLIMVLGMWLLYFLNIDLGWHAEELGLKPLELSGLVGILLMPFLHENMEHLFSNSVPLLVAGSFLFYYFKKLTWLISLVVWLMGGMILWCIGLPNTIHIGASGLVYGLVFFLLLSGIIRGHRNLAAVALLMVFLYGSLFWGIFPDYVLLIKENISWEGHLGGAISGMLMAVLLRNKGPQKPIENISPDDDDDTMDEENQYWMQEDDIANAKDPALENTESEKPSFTFRYVPKNANPWEQYE